MLIGQARVWWKTGQDVTGTVLAVALTTRRMAPAEVAQRHCMPQANTGQAVHAVDAGAKMRDGVGISTTFGSQPIREQLIQSRNAE